ncbi:hypothetical protein [Bacillus sp. FJAT-52991]|uniref:Uncharacterized protein n=1 Tax=Bacillus kandeliae TaxID=3129297 RepID=A0ABZ2N1F7_9BACI
MSNDRRHCDRFDDDVAGIFDRNDRKVVLDVDKLIIRADDVVIVKKRRDRFDNDVADIFDRDDRRDHKRRRC